MPQQQPGSYQGGEMMMMKSVIWWRKPEYPEETTDLRQVTDEAFHTYGLCPVRGLNLGRSGVKQVGSGRRGLHLECSDFEVYAYGLKKYGLMRSEIMYRLVKRCLLPKPLNQIEPIAGMAPVVYVYTVPFRLHCPAAYFTLTRLGHLLCY